MWLNGSWEKDCDHHITLLELYPIVLAILTWPDKLKNAAILFFCDNQSVVNIINNQTSRDPTIMKLVRLFVLSCLKFNINFKAKHIPGVHNVTADCLSRFQVAKARQHQPGLKSLPTAVSVTLQLSTMLQEN